MAKDPMAELQPQFSSDDATPTPWAEARERLEKAEVYWLATVRPDGRPRVTPVVAVWQDGACTASWSFLLFWGAESVSSETGAMPLF